MYTIWCLQFPLCTYFWEKNCSTPKNENNTIFYLLRNKCNNIYQMKIIITSTYIHRIAYPTWTNWNTRENGKYTTNFADILYCIYEYESSIIIYVTLKRTPPSTEKITSQQTHTLLVNRTQTIIQNVLTNCNQH